MELCGQLKPIEMVRWIAQGLCNNSRVTSHTNHMTPCFIIAEFTSTSEELAAQSEALSALVSAFRLSNTQQTTTNQDPFGADGVAHDFGFDELGSF